MTIRTVSALLFTILLISNFPKLALGRMQALEQDQPIMMLAGKPVPKEELIYLISKGNPAELGKGLLSREEFEENLAVFIDFKLKVAEAEAQNLDKSEEFNREFDSFKENLKAPFLIKNSLEEGELRKSYSRMQEVIRASHILIQFPPNPSRDDSLAVLKMALKVKNEIEQNGNINDLALKYSDDPSAKINKGDLGYFTSLQMVQSFEEAAYNLQTGQVSDPVLTNFGYHIIQVTDRQPNPGQVQVSHLLVRVDEKSPTGEDQARRKIADIYTEVQKENTIWEEIVKTYTEDPASKQNGGNLPWFNIGSMIPEFEIAAYSLTEIGEISPPVRTQYGYHILRLEGKKPMESFEELEEIIRSKILRNSRSVMIQSQVMAIQKARYGFDENEVNIENIGKTLNNLNKTDFIPALENSTIASSELFTLVGQTYTLKDLAKYAREKEILPSSNIGIFDAWYDRFTASKLNQAEEDDLLANNKEYQLLLNEYREGILLFSLMNEEVWQKGIQDTLGQINYFNQNIQNYQWKTRVNAYIIKILDANQLEPARSEVRGLPLDQELISKFENGLKTNKTLAFQTESGFFEYENHPILSKANQNLPYQEIKSEGITHLVLLGEKIAGGPKKFEDTRGLVIRDYQNHLETKLLENLTKKYPVIVNPQVKEEVFTSLNQL